VDGGVDGTEGGVEGAEGVDPEGGVPLFEGVLESFEAPVVPEFVVCAVEERNPGRDEIAEAATSFVSLIIASRIKSACAA
jgi:hypothetical protein